MSGRLIPHLEILPESQRRLWPELRTLRRFGFVLYGGTAIALRIGHRSSVDFDFFADRSFRHSDLFASVPFLSDAQVLQNAPNTLTVVTTGGVNVSLFGGIRFGRVGFPDLTMDGAVEVASLDDLLATKLAVLLQRIESKDYFDIHALLEAGVRLEHGLAGARALYGSSFQSSESLRALTYFEGGDLDQLPEPVRRSLIAEATGVRSLPEVRKVSNRLGSGETTE